MRKLILILFILLSCASLANSGGIISFPGGGVPSATTYPDIILDMNAESGSGSWSGSYVVNGTGECYNEDGTGTINQAVTAETSTPLSGATSFTWDTTSDYIVFDFTTAMTKGRIGAYIRIDNYTVDTPLLSIRDAGSPYDQVTLEMKEGSMIGVQFDDGPSSDSTLVSTTAASSVHYYEVAFDTTVGAGTDYVKIYADGGAAENTITGTWEGLTFSNFWIGNTSGSQSGDATIDRIRISTDPLRDLNALKDIVTLTGACP